jgi:hypothetical protein
MIDENSGYIRFRIDPMLKELFRSIASEEHPEIAESQVMSLSLREIIVDYVLKTINKRGYVYMKELYFLHKAIGDIAVFVREDDIFDHHDYDASPDMHMIGLIKSVKIVEEYGPYEEGDYDLIPYTAEVDFYAYKEYNKDIVQPRYYCNDGSSVGQTWFDLGHTHKNGIMSIFEFTGNEEIKLMVMSKKAADKFIESEDGKALRKECIEFKNKGSWENGQMEEISKVSSIKNLIQHSQIDETNIIEAIKNNVEIAVSKTLKDLFYTPIEHSIKEAIKKEDIDEEDCKKLENIVKKINAKHNE